MSNNTSIWVVIPNWNGKSQLEKCLGALRKVSDIKIVVVDNNSSDGSVEFIKKNFSNILVIENEKNLGFAGGVNRGIEKALSYNAKYVALLNNDVVISDGWVQSLINTLEEDDTVGAATGKLLYKDGKKVDNTGDEYSVWGLTIARDRDVKTEKLETNGGEVYGACAGAAMYRAEVFKDVGMFDEKFFAYYEDSDLNFRMQLAGWKTKYQGGAIAFHDTGATSRKISGFTTLQTIKNQPMLFWKNMPSGLLLKTFPRFFLAHSAVILSTVSKGQVLTAFKGLILCFKNTPHYFIERRKIQKNRKVDNDYIWSILYKDLPPTAHRLRRFRSFFIRSS